MDEITIIYLDKANGTCLESIIDTEDLKKVLSNKGKWYAKYDSHIKGFYAVCSIYNRTPKHGKNTTMRLSKFLVNCPHNKSIDHINHNTLDDRKSNLRVIDATLNSMNRKSKNSNNKSGYRNVCLIKNKWVVQLQINKKNTILGRFDYGELDEAGQFAETMRQKYYGDYAGKD